MLEIILYKITNNMIIFDKSNRIMIYELIDNIKKLQDILKDEESFVDYVEKKIKDFLIRHDFLLDGKIKKLSFRKKILKKKFKENFKCIKVMV
jgi:hypothetical protein